MESDSIFHNPYIEKLLSAEIRLWEIPKEELRGSMAWEIYLSAFRADRALSKSHYETDLCLLADIFVRGFRQKYSGAYSLLGDFGNGKMR